MQVKVEDIQGRIHEVSQPFSLDNSKPALKLFSQWPLNVYFPDVVSKSFILFSLFCKLVIFNLIKTYIIIILYFQDIAFKI